MFSNIYFELTPNVQVLEDRHFSLTDVSNLRVQCIPYIHHSEIQRVREAIKGKFKCFIFDGTSRLGEAFAVVCRYVTADLNIHHKLIAFRVVSQSMTGIQIVSLLNQCICDSGSKVLEVVGLARDQASTNNVAVSQLQNLYPHAEDINCLSHVLSNVGKAIVTPTLEEFTKQWTGIFKNSPGAKFHFRQTSSLVGFSRTRWWSKWELWEQLNKKWSEVLEVSFECSLFSSQKIVPDAVDNIFI